MKKYDYYRMNICLSQKTNKQIEQHAKLKGRRKTTTIRLILEDYYKKIEEKTNDKSIGR